MTIKVFVMTCDKGLHLGYLALKSEVSFPHNRYLCDAGGAHNCAQKLGNARYRLDITLHKHYIALN